LRALIAAVCAALTVALGLVVPDGPTGVDEAVVSAVVGWPHWVLRVLVLPTEPYVVLPALALLVFWCRSRSWDAVFVVVAPAVAVAANTWVLKPVFDRWKGDTLVYPSGHTVSLAATLVVAYVLIERSRTLVVVLGVLLLIGATLGMVGLGYHYATDVPGGVLFAIFAVFVTRGLLSRRAVT
jgi:membrane-associated phospholipid phosphatase